MAPLVRTPREPAQFVSYLFVLTKPALVSAPSRFAFTLTVLGTVIDQNKNDRARLCTTIGPCVICAALNDHVTCLEQDIIFSSSISIQISPLEQETSDQQRDEAC